MSASAAVIASWSMTTAVPGSTTGTSYNYGAADSGDLASGTMLSSAHAFAGTTYSSPAGNGSTYSFSANNWTIGDYYQVSVSTIGYSGVSISWDQTRSGTGPVTFDAVMSVDGGVNWTTILAGYSVVQAGFAGTGTTSWNNVTVQTGFTLTAAAGAAADEQANVLFRLRSTVTTSAAGSNRIDNFIVSAVPAPGAIALLGLAGLIGRRRR
jgi:MYXO-CTERM domain-containing protein